MPLRDSKSQSVAVVEDGPLSQPMSCMYCNEDLTPFSVSQRQSHYDCHIGHGNEQTMEGSPTKPIVIDDTFDDLPLSRPKQFSDSPASSSKNGRKKMFPCQKETDDFWYAAQVANPPSNFTPGLIQVLKKGLLKGHSRGLVRRAALCYGGAVHIGTQSWDANWGCGYRNFLMACAGLMIQTTQPFYFPLLDSPLSPSIRNLQRWIESAWNEGYDPEGRQELKNLVNTKKWIGTADLWVAFIYRGIPAELVDFDYTKHGQAKASELVIKWVVEYFTPKSTLSRPTNIFESMKASSINMTDKMPLILQHDGHSRTVVGYEIDKNGTINLLIFDPSYRPDANVRAASLAEFSSSHSQVSDSTTSNPSLKRKRSKTSPDENDQRSESGRMPTASTSKPLISRKNDIQANKGSAGLGKRKEVDTYDVVKKCRLDSKKLNKKKQYQILYFPMTAPLTDYEKSQKKQVRSTKIS